MVNESFRKDWVLKKVFEQREINKESNRNLVYPERIKVTDILLSRKGLNLFAKVYGLIKPEYIGKKIRIIESYYESYCRETQVQELFVNGMRLENQMVVFRTELSSLCHNQK